MEIEFPAQCLLIGPTNCGKTHLINQLLTKEHVFDKKIEKIYYCSKYRSAIPSELKNDKRLVFLSSLPNDESDLLENPENLNTIFVIDDQLEHGFDSNFVSSLFTSARHKNTGVIMTSQVLFPKAKKSRNISLNASHLFLFKNFRDSTSFGYLARQISRKNSKALVDLFLDITDKPYTYLLISCSPVTKSIFRISSHILDDPFCIYTDENEIEKSTQT